MESEKATASAATSASAEVEMTAPVDFLASNGPDYSSISSAAALVSPSSEEFDLITARIRTLVEEGRGEAIYEVGVPLAGSDVAGENADGMPVEGLAEEEYEASVATLESIAATLNARCVMLRDKFADEAKTRRTAQFLVRRSGTGRELVSH